MPVTAVIYASHTGRPTYDDGVGGGNPFASALVELLAKRSLSYAELCRDLVSLTKQKSDGLQVPDVVQVAGPTRWRIQPVPNGARRLALVFVYSDYRELRLPSLPGAALDLSRVSGALSGAGFKVVSLLDPHDLELHSAFEAISGESESAEAAVIYMTGHGFENAGEVFLKSPQQSLGAGESRGELAVRGLSGSLKAQRANLVLYGGCRTRE